MGSPTYSPAGLVDPSGSVAGQVLTSTGPTSAPKWTASSLTGALLASKNLSDITSLAQTYANLGLGSAATYATGTSGATVPLLNGVNSWSGVQTFLSGIKGTATNDSATAGNVGEYMTAAVTAATAITNATQTNLASLSLTAGDWEVWGNATYTLGASTTSGQFLTSVSQTSATQASAPDLSQNAVSGLSAGQVYSQPAPRVRISLSGTTTVYLVGFSSAASGSACTFQARISARRMR